MPDLTPNTIRVGVDELQRDSLITLISSSPKSRVLSDIYCTLTQNIFEAITLQNDFIKEDKPMREP